MLPLDSSFSTNNAIFIFCLFILFDAFVTVSRLNRLQTGSQSPNDGQRQQTNKHEQKNADLIVRSSRASPHKDQSTPKSNSIMDNADNLKISGPSPKAKAKSDAAEKNGTGLSQTPVGKSSSSSVPNPSPDVSCKLMNDPQKNSAVKRYISRFSSVDSTSMPSPKKRVQFKGTVDFDVDDDDVVFLGDVDERGLHNSTSLDEELDGMNLIVSKRLVGVSIEEFYDTCWSDILPTNGGRDSSFYRSWLMSCGKSDVMVSNWEYAREGQEFPGKRYGDKFTQRRLVTFKYRRTTDLHCASLDAEVQQVQLCRMEGKDKFVVSIGIDTRGVPFADSFDLELRWIVTRVDANELYVRVGAIVDFVKPIVLAGKLRSELINEAAKEQLDLLKSMKKACATRVQKCRDVVATGGDVFDLSNIILRFLKLGDQNHCRQTKDDLFGSIGKADERLRQIMTLLEKRLSEGQHREVDPDALRQLETVNHVLDQLAANLQTT